MSRQLLHALKVSAYIDIHICGELAPYSLYLTVKCSSHRDGRPYMSPAHHFFL